ncbi:MAG: hypothetical protein WCV83_04060 [Candidatus Magasanikbacteria bacterium]
MWIKPLFKNVLASAIFAGLVYFNVVSLQNAFFGWVILFLFLWWASKSAHVFLTKFFNLSEALRVRVLALFLTLALLGFIAGILAWVYQITPVILSLSFFIVGVLSTYLKILAGEADEVVPEIEDGHKQVIEEMPSAKIGLVLYLFLVFIGFYILNASKSEAIIFTPWQTISVSYVYVFFVATIVLGCLIFSRLKSSTLLFLLILHSLLLHAYLPLSHVLFYGADGWRHLAIENSMLSGTIEKTLSYSTAQFSFWQRFNFGTLAYAQFSSLAILFKSLCQLDFIVFLKYFIPIIWSVTLPIILLEIARTFDWEKKRALLLVWFSTLPFALQVSGSFSLPSNLSFLFWLFVLLLQFKYRQKISTVGNIAILGLGALMLFGHSLYFILFCLTFVLIRFLDITETRKMFNKFKILLAIVFSVLLIPSMELISNFSKLSTHINWWAQTKAVLSSFSAWYLATGLRVSDITAGNIIFNQPPLNVLVTNIFTINRFWICGFMLLFWIIFIVGWYKIFSKQKSNEYLVWSTTTIGLLGGYVISRYFLIGENILSRRLDAVLSILIILPVAYYLFEIIVSQKNIFYQRIVLFLVILFCSMAITASYTLGPDTQAVGVSQYQAANYVWENSQNSGPACVLSDTYTLLALEGLSAQKIVGGGFPINLYFTQPEREQLLKTAQTEPQLAITQAKNLLNANNCFLIGEYNLSYPVFQFDNIKIYNN